MPTRTRERRLTAAGLAAAWLVIASISLTTGGLGLARLLVAVVALVPAGVCLLAAARPRAAHHGPGPERLVALTSLLLAIGLTLALAERWRTPTPGLGLDSPGLAYGLLAALSASSLYAGLLLDGLRRAAIVAGIATGLALAGTFTALLLAPPGATGLPACAAPRTADMAEVAITAEARLDGVVIATAGLEGERSGLDEHWSGHWSGAVLDDGSAELVRVGDRRWLRLDDGEWQPMTADETAFDRLTLDTRLVDLLATFEMAAAEDLGVELINDQPARRCRLIIDGAAAGEAILPLGWLVGDGQLEGHTELPIWRGELDWWTNAGARLLRGQLQVSGHPADAWGVSELRGTLRAELEISHPAAPLQIREPLP